EPIQAGIGGAPIVEILSGEYDPVVSAVSKGRLQLQTVQEVVLIGREACWSEVVGECRIQPLEFANVAAAQGQPPIIALILVLGIEADVGESIRLRKYRGRERCETGIDPGMDVELPAERADHQRVSAPMRLQRDAPIGRNAAELSGRPERVGAETVLRAKAERLVTGEFEVKQVVDKGIGADAADMRGEGALDHRSRVLRTKDIRYSVREAPCRRRVPDVLHRRIVVGGDAVDDIERTEMGGAGVT